MQSLHSCKSKGSSTRSRRVEGDKVARWQDPCSWGRLPGWARGPRSSSEDLFHPRSHLYQHILWKNIAISMAIYDCKTWLQYKVSVVQSSFQIEDSFLCKSEKSWDENENIVRSEGNVETWWQTCLGCRPRSRGIHSTEHHTPPAMELVTGLT